MPYLRPSQLFQPNFDALARQVQAAKAAQDHAYEAAEAARNAHAASLSPSPNTRRGRLTASPSAPSSSRPSQSPAHRLMAAEQIYKASRIAHAEALCELGDAHYLCGLREVAEDSWSQLVGSGVHGAPELGRPRLRIDALWLTRRLSAQRDDPDAMALTLMHRAAHAPCPPEVLAQARQLSQAAAPALRIRVILYLVAQGDLAQAESAAWALAQDDPAYAMARFTLGRVLFLRDKFSSAKDQFDQVGANLFANQYIDFWRGRTCIELQVRDQAHTYLLHVATLIPSSSRVRLDIGANALGRRQPEVARDYLLPLLADRQNPECRSLQEFLGLTVEGLSQSVDQAYAHAPRLKPWPRALVVDRLHHMLILAAADELSTSLALLDSVVRQRLPGSLVRRAFDAAWAQAFAPEIDAMHARGRSPTLRIDS